MTTEPIQCAAAVCVREHAGKLEALLVLRGQAPRAGEWSIPGGRMEPGETEEVAALRELHEETGVRARLVEKLCTLTPVFDGTPYALHDWLAVWESGKAIAGDDAAAVRWVSADDARALELWPPTLEVVLQALQRARETLT